MLNLLSDNLNMLMAKARLNSNELARKIGIPATTIKRIRNNEQANPTIGTLLPIAHYFSISLNQLLGNEPLHSIETNSLYKIPLLTWKECIDYSSLNYEMFSNKILTERKVSSKSFALIHEDNDIEIFPLKSILIIDPEQQIASGDFVIVANTEQKIASIRKYIIELDQIYLKSLISGTTISVLTPLYKILGVIIQYKLELKTESL